MRQSRTIIFTALLTLAASSIANAGSVNDNCNCKKKQLTTGCDKPVVNSPSWWGWLTNSSDFQFHFFDLIELLNDENDKVVMSRKKPKQEELAS